MVDLHVWDRATPSLLYYNSYCKASGQLLRQNPNNDLYCATMEGQRVLQLFYGFLFELIRGNVEQLHVGMMKG